MTETERPRIPLAEVQAIILRLIGAHIDSGTQDFYQEIELMIKEWEKRAKDEDSTSILPFKKLLTDTLRKAEKDNFLINEEKHARAKDLWTGLGWKLQKEVNQNK